jgi:hypothetical protein
MTKNKDTKQMEQTAENQAEKETLISENESRATENGEATQSEEVSEN